MANKRMFTMKIVDSDAFLDMPLSSQCLYFHLNMRADDDGFIGNPKRVMKIVGASEDDLKLLIAKSFLLVFENGVIVIKHWRMHNTLSKSRYHETTYTDEKGCLKIKKNNSYSLTSGEPIDDSKLIGMFSGIPNESQVEIAVLNEGKELEKELNDVSPISTQVKEPTKRKKFVPPKVKEVEEYCAKRNNGIDAEEFVDFYESKGWMVGKNKMVNWKSAVNTWERKRGFKLKSAPEPGLSKIKAKSDEESVDYMKMWESYDWGGQK